MGLRKLDPYHNPLPFFNLNCRMFRSQSTITIAISLLRDLTIRIWIWGSILVVLRGFLGSWVKYWVLLVIYFCILFFWRHLLCISCWWPCFWSSLKGWGLWRFRFVLMLFGLIKPWSILKAGVCRGRWPPYLHLG